MKGIALLVALTYSHSLFCQDSTKKASIHNLNGIWVTNEQDALLIDDPSKTANYIANQNLDYNMVRLYVYGDTLSFQNRYYIAGRESEKFIDRYDLLVKSRSDTTLEVVPVSTQSKTFFQNREVLRFVRQEFRKTASIHFEKIIYHSSTCYETCPIIHLEINKDKEVYFSGTFYNKSYYDIDTSVSGNYAGMISDQMYDKLINLLQISDIENLRFSNALSSDLPTTTIIIYYNGTRKYLKSKIIPVQAFKLVEFLYNSWKSLNLQRIKAPSHFEE
jgi:hypothetical protein